MVVDTSLLSSCARAATAAEARYRIDAPVESRAARVIALDDRAADVVRSVATQEWASARFFVCEDVPVSGGVTGGDFLLRGIDGSPAVLGDELSGAHVVVMVATQDSGAACAYAIGHACWERAIMTAGLVLGDGFAAQDAVAALRPHARVLLPSADESDVVELLTALRV
jgi:hypothetical protein